MKMNDANTTPPGAAGVIRLDPRDNVGAVTATVEVGAVLSVEGTPLEVVDRILAGHKVALAPIAQGEKVIKWAVPIGSATRAIRPGENVHLHNLKSDYLPTYTLDGGNPYLARDRAADEGRGPRES